MKNFYVHPCVRLHENIFTTHMIRMKKLHAMTSKAKKYWFLISNTAHEKLNDISEKLHSFAPLLFFMR